MHVAETPPPLPFVPKAVDSELDLSASRPPPLPKKSVIPEITPKALLLCVLVVVPAVLGAKIAGVLSFAALVAFYQSAVGVTTLCEIEQQGIQFISCGIAGFVFVCLGILMTSKVIQISRWFFLAFAIVGAIALFGLNGVAGLIGQVIGAVLATYILYDG